MASYEDRRAHFEGEYGGRPLQSTPARWERDTQPDVSSQERSRKRTEWELQAHIGELQGQVGELTEKLRWEMHASANLSQRVEELKSQNEALRAANDELRHAVIGPRETT